MQPVNRSANLPPPSGTDPRSLHVFHQQTIAAVNSTLDSFGTRLNQVLPKDGSEPMTGPLTLSGNPTSSLHAADKSYVDAGDAASQTLAVGGDLTGHLPNPTLAISGVTAGTYTPMVKVTFDAKGRATSASSIVPPWFVGGLALSNDGTSPNTVIDISAGASTSDDLSTYMSQPNAYTKTTSAWAVGSGNGSLDTGSVAASTWYHVYQIERTDTGVVDYLISTSATSPTMPANYTKKRRIGSFKTDASSHILAFTQYGHGNRRTYNWSVGVEDINASSVNNGSNTTLTLPSVPAGVKVLARLIVQITGTTKALANIWTPDQANSQPVTDLVQQVASLAFAAEVFIWTNTSQQVLMKSNVSGTTANIATMGWDEDI